MHQNNSLVDGIAAGLHAGHASQKRDCHSADALSPSLLTHLPNVEGGEVDRAAAAVIVCGSGAGFHSDFIWSGAADYSPLLALPAVLDGFWGEVGLDNAIRFAPMLSARPARLHALSLHCFWGPSVAVLFGFFHSDFLLRQKQRRGHSGPANCRSALQLSTCDGCSCSCDCPIVLLFASPVDSFVFLLPLLLLISCDLAPFISPVHQPNSTTSRIHSDSSR